jgi:uncharacterized membrane protein YbhN (UPF0104 family)
LANECKEAVRIAFDTVKTITKNERAIHVAFLLAGIAILAYVLTTISIADIISAFSMLGYSMVILAVILILVLAIRSLRLKLLMKRLADVSFFNVFKIVFETALFAIYSPGKAGEVTKLDLFKKYGISRTQSMSAIIVERAYDLVVVTVLSAGMLISLGVNMLFVLVAGTAAVVLAAALYKSNVFGGLLTKMFDSMKMFLNVKAVAIMLALTIVMWLADASAMYFVLRMLGHDVRLDILVPVYFASTIIGLISMIPGGLGASEFSFSYALTAMAGVPAADAMATMLASRIVTFLVCLVGSVLYFIEMRGVIRNG